MSIDDFVSVARPLVLRDEMTKERKRERERETDREGTILSFVRYRYSVVID